MQNEEIAKNLVKKISTFYNAWSGLKLIVTIP